jgi:carboxymethylenebutenolidase
MTNLGEKKCVIDGVEHYLAHAENSSKYGLLLLPFFYGLTPHMRWVAENYAASGITTLIWNCYPEIEWGAPITLSTRPARPNDAQGLASQSKCIDFMEQELGLTSIGGIGYCMGARSLLLLGANEHRLKAIVPVYPSIRGQLQKDEDMDPISRSAEIRCPVQLICAGNDPVTPKPIFDLLISVLNQRLGLGAETSTLFYPEAGHGFMHIPNQVNDAATLTALPQIQTFLDIYLKVAANGQALALPPVRGDYEPTPPANPR